MEFAVEAQKLIAITLAEKWQSFPTLTRGYFVKVALF
jgi:hypothetical protein